MTDMIYFVNVILVCYCSSVCILLKLSFGEPMMSTDSSPIEDTKSTRLLADVTDDSCRLKYTEKVPVTRDTDGGCTTECDSGDWSAPVKQQSLPVVKQEPQDVCSLVFI